MEDVSDLIFGLTTVLQYLRQSGTDWERDRQVVQLNKKGPRKDTQHNQLIFEANTDQFKGAGNTFSTGDAGLPVNTG